MVDITESAPQIKDEEIVGKYRKKTMDDEKLDCEAVGKLRHVALEVGVVPEGEVERLESAPAPARKPRTTRSE